MAAELLAPAQREFIDPVRIDHVRGVEIRWCAQLLGHPSIDDLAGETKTFEHADSFSVRADVDGFGIRIVDIKSQSTGMAAQANLSRVVGAVADTRPRIQRSGLGGKESVRTLLTIDRRAGRDTRPTGRARVSPVSGQVSGGQGRALI